MNLHGSVVLPGFFDSHIHLLNYGMLLRTLNLSKTRSIQEIMEKIVEAGSSQSHKWILGRGWDDEKLREHRYPNRDDLDRVTSRPVFLKRVCGHVAVANSEALRIAGIDKDTTDPEGGVIVRDGNLQPNGVLKEHAISLVEKVVPQFTDDTERALTLASRKLMKLGITSLQCIVSDSTELVSLRKLKREGKVVQSIYAIVPLNLFDELISLGLTTEEGEGGFRIGGVKLFLDGSLGARTAALSSPYHDEPTSSGLITMKKEELRRVALTAKEIGFQLCIHAIGDKAVELAIEVIDESIGSRLSKAMRNRIEHASVTTSEEIRDMRRLGIIASVQPRFIYSDSWAEERLGPERVKDIYPFASFAKSEIVLAAGSDCPVEDPNPFEGIWSATVRPGLNGSERLEVNEVLEAYTKSAAFASFCENARGTLEPGKIADMIVVDRDPFTVAVDDLRRTKVTRTIISGKIFS
ncbi:amidohydrolase [Candidatus Bathyarchaeota archaeon]|nr:amidohydrolase [Candidatus Bathyarchaeota archaeon]